MYINEYKNKVATTMIKRYGFKSPLQSPKILKKQKETVLKKYGVDNVMKIKEISNKANINAQKTFHLKYGVDNPMRLEFFREKQRMSYFKNGTTPTSNQQRYLNDKLGGILNHPIGQCSLDIAFINEKIYLEYNGGGHDLIVKLGGISRETFNTKEIRRYQFLKSEGWKGIFINSPYDYIPIEDVLKNEIEKAFKWLKTDSKGHSHYNINIGKSINDINFGRLRKINKEDLAEVI
ncbi:hypothetical protein Ctaglu_20500 [Clostridium tagluense]|uniref:DUF7487 domain-containing protein n=1 Tax=Clostridium tagluense TaxID=360422 RepID=A0A401ULM5_9CLOT|nr:hypothetical protein [Clostridium tagluense]GCD10427.1 hypothetical protein Ctaglu_20500 [Clostridium tagluense]